MKEALYYTSSDNNVICRLCPHNCHIPPDKSGICKVRKNIKGKLYALTYNHPFPGSIDPIEKKPLFHYFPGQSIFSIGTVGCNMSCMHCQNFETSQSGPEDYNLPTITPTQLIDQTTTGMIAYTYNEPTIYYEYMLDCAKLAKQHNIKNVIVSNGYINQPPLIELCKYIDAANIDLKSFDNKFYKDICNAEISPVLETLKTLQKNNIWLEITNLIIPNHNDTPQQITKLCQWIKDNLGPDVPLHFSAFYPTYKLTNSPPTPISTLIKAKDIAQKIGIRYIYLGNVRSDENTYCNNCKNLLIKRTGYSTKITGLNTNQCNSCHTIIPGKY